MHATTGRPRKDKGLIRALNRTQTDTGKSRAAERSGVRLREPSACELCGAVFSRRVWRRGAPVSHGMLSRVHWVVCPACKQARNAEYFGRVMIHGDLAREHEDLIRRRIDNVVARGLATQPQRRVVSFERRGDVLEVLTTSQKLAHRIAHELEKLLGGRPRYQWSDDGSLFVRWKPARRA